MEPTVATWITLLVIGGFVWGGCAIALTMAVRKESVKADATRFAEPP